VPSDEPIEKIVATRPHCKKDSDWNSIAEVVKKTKGNFCHVATNSELVLDGSWKASLNGQTLDLWVMKGDTLGEIVRVGNFSINMKSLSSGKCGSDRKSQLDERVVKTQSRVALKDLKCGYGGKGYLYFRLPERKSVLLVSGAMTLLDELPSKVNVTADLCTELRVALPADWNIHAAAVERLNGKCLTDGSNNITFNGSWKISDEQIWVYDAGLGITKVGFAGHSVDVGPVGIDTLPSGLNKC
jgi:hypothetical protein